MTLVQTPVSLSHVKDHLILIAAFLNIYKKAEDSSISLDPTTGLPIPTSHTIRCLTRSLKRFEAWISTLDTNIAEPGLKDYEIPPLDVLMFLHSYMLSPLDFYEDSITRHKVLKRVAEFPLSRVATFINKETLEYLPTTEQRRYWEAATSQPYEIPFAWPASDTLTIVCPLCGVNVHVSWADLAISESVASKYPCLNFQAKCAACSLVIDNEVIRTGRFLQDVYRGQVARTVLDATGATPDFSAAKAASHQILTVLGPSLDLGDIAYAFDWNIDRMFEHIMSSIDERSSLRIKLPDIKEAYSSCENFSLNLIDAVLRQARFIFQMSAMGWLDPGRFDVNDDALVQATKNYSHFLRIKPDGIIVRWDIDLVFHTHQLFGPKYRSDTLRIIGHVLDHDDKQPQDVIVDAAKLADTVWKDNFGQSYLVPHDPGLLSALTKTVCGGSSGGACVAKGGGKGDGQKGGGGKSRVIAFEESKEGIIVN